MRLRFANSIVALALAVGFARAQLPPIPMPVVELPPITLVTAIEPILVPNGTPVSKPLQSVVVPEPAAKVEAIPPAVETPPPTPEITAPANGYPHSWSKYDLLFWWPKAQPLPPLVTGSRSLLPPILGQPNTVILAGNRSLDTQEHAGGRFTWGNSISTDNSLGMEFTYLFLGTRTFNAPFAENLSRYPVIGRPFHNAVSGKDDVLITSFPGVISGLVNVSTTTRVSGWEVTGVAHVQSGPRSHVSILAGYRYFQTNEGLRVEQTAYRIPSFANPGILSTVADQIDAHNRFHGGQLGLESEYSHGSLFVEVVGKVALGQTIEVLRTSGQTSIITAGAALPLLQSYPSGVLVQASNSGRIVRSAFAVLPEAQVKFGLKFNDKSRVYVGYNFLYLSDAIRPGDQVDRTLDPNGIAIATNSAQSQAVVQERPAVLFHRGDFWVQGLTFGLDCRY